MTGTKHLDEFEELRRAQEDFSRIPKRKEDRPLVGVVGEFYVRLHDGANQDIIRKLESGGRDWLAPMTEFFAYANFIGRCFRRPARDSGFSMEEIKEFTARWVNPKLAARTSARCSTPACRSDGYDDISSAEVIRGGSKYVDYSFGGGAIGSMGKSGDFAKRGLAGIVSVIPFNCMPGNTVTALSQSLRRRHNNIPFLNPDYDGFIDSSRDSKIVNFMWQVKERYLGQKLAHSEVEGEMKSRV